MDDDDRVFKALADPTRRHLLDRLFERDGRTLTELESELEMTRFGVMKHLRLLEDAGLVVTRRSGREKLHFLNPVPIRQIHDRWIDKYTERVVSALARSQKRPGGDSMSTMTQTTAQVYQLFIKATPEQIWEAIVDARADVEVFLRLADHDHSGRPPSRRARTASQSWGDSEVLESDPPTQARPRLAVGVRPGAGGRGRRAA